MYKTLCMHKTHDMISWSLFYDLLSLQTVPVTV